MVSRGYHVLTYDHPQNIPCILFKHCICYLRHVYIHQFLVQKNTLTKSKRLTEGVSSGGTVAHIHFL